MDRSRSTTNNNNSLLRQFLTSPILRNDPTDLGVHLLLAGFHYDLAVFDRCSEGPEGIETWGVFDIAGMDIEAG